MSENLQTVINLLGAHCKRLEEEIARLRHDNEVLRNKAANDAERAAWPKKLPEVFGPTRYPDWPTNREVRMHA